jgi:hypothetical protein
MARPARCASRLFPVVFPPKASGAANQGIERPLPKDG